MTESSFPVLGATSASHSEYCSSPFAARGLDPVSCPNVWQSNYHFCLYCTCVLLLFIFKYFGNYCTLFNLEIFLTFFSRTLHMQVYFYIQNCKNAQSSCFCFCFVFSLSSVGRFLSRRRWNWRTLGPRYFVCVSIVFLYGVYTRFFFLSFYPGNRPVKGIFFSFILFFLRDAFAG